MNFSANVKVQGQFKMIFKKNGIVTKETDWMKNLVLNSGLARMPDATWINRCLIGNHGNPLVTDTKLDTFLASSSALSGTTTGTDVTNPDEPFYWVQGTYRFAENVGNGNIGALALGWSDNDCVNIVQVKDPSGTPIVVQKTADETLDIQVRWHVYMQATSTQTLNVKDKFGATTSTHAITVKPRMGGSVAFNATVVVLGRGGGVSVYSGTIPAAINALPTGELIAPSAQGGVKVSSSEGSITYRFTIQVNNATGNWRSVFVPVGGLMTRASSTDTGYIFQIDPIVPKLATEKITCSFTLNFGRYGE